MTGVAVAPGDGRVSPGAGDGRISPGGFDHDLVARVRRGDDRAFEELFQRYQRRIAAYVYGMVHDYARAEDITQDVFISALRRMRETERPIAFKPWIYEIAKNACIDQFRRSRRAEEVSYDAEEGLAPSDHGRLANNEPTLDATLDTKQQLNHLRGAFDGLSDTHHQILVMRELEGLSYREIGERLGMSRPGVESTLFRARRRLQEEYDDLASGRRCLTIQGIIAAASGGIGSRDTRRLSRHLAHCQPCRRHAYAAGLDCATLVRRRDRVAAKVAALFPFPSFWRFRGGGNGGSFVAQAAASAPVGEQAAAGIAKTVAAAIALIVASVGAGLGSHSLSQSLASPGQGGAAKHKAGLAGRPNAPSRQVSGAAAPAQPGAAGGGSGTSGARSGSNDSGSRGGSGSGSTSGGSGSGSGSGAGASAGAGGGAAGTVGGVTDQVGKTVSGVTGGGGTPSTSGAGGTVEQVGDTVGNTVSGVGGAVGGAVDDAGNGSAPDVGGTVDQVGDTVGDAVEDVGDAVGGGTSGGVGSGGGGTAGGATGAVGGAVQDTTGDAGGAVDDATGAVGGAVDSGTQAVDDATGGVADALP